MPSELCLKRSMPNFIDHGKLHRNRKRNKLQSQTTQALSETKSILEPLEQVNGHLSSADRGHDSMVISPERSEYKRLPSAVKGGVEKTTMDQDCARLLHDIIVTHMSDHLATATELEADEAALERVVAKTSREDLMKERKQMI